MEIILGKTAGFCYGVRNAVEESKKSAETDEEVYCLGEIVHNKSVIDELRKMGIKFIDDINDVKGKLIIRAHGISKDLYEKLNERKIEIKDLTCPNVLKTHKVAEEYSKKNYFIILIGIKNHPEAIGTLSFCGKNSYLLQEKEDIADAVYAINKSKLKNILVMAQTTYNSKKFDDILKDIKNELKDKNLEVRKTICEATEVRQKETIEIAQKVDIMIIVGDKKSSNTNKLYDISNSYCKKTLFIQNESELNIDDLQNENKIGIMAGASTPKEDIEKIIMKIRRSEKCSV